MSRIVVVGSSNTDMVIKSSHLPKPGETVLGGDFNMNFGGKGANQAMAAAKLGGSVSFVARIGNDIFGLEASKGYDQQGIDREHVSIDPSSSTGVALIMVDADGENCISVASGANFRLGIDNIKKASKKIKEAGFVLLQLEIPLDVVAYTVDLAYKYQVPVILNPAPAQQLDEQLLTRIFAITPNESEASILTGIDVTNVKSAAKAAGYLRKKGINNVVITMGKTGAYLLSDAHEGLVPGEDVSAVDTTAAGDTFNGAFAVALSEGISIKNAVSFANKAAALSVMKLGAQTSVPSREEVVNFKS